MYLYNTYEIIKHHIYYPEGGGGDDVRQFHFILSNSFMLFSTIRTYLTILVVHDVCIYVQHTTYIIIYPHTSDNVPRVNTPCHR